MSRVLWLGAAVAMLCEACSGSSVSGSVGDDPAYAGHGRADPAEGEFVDLAAGIYSACGVGVTRSVGARVELVRGGEIECWGDDSDKPLTRVPYEVP